MRRVFALQPARRNHKIVGVPKEPPRPESPYGDAVRGPIGSSHSAVRRSDARATAAVSLPGAPGQCRSAPRPPPSPRQPPAQPRPQPDPPGTGTLGSTVEPGPYPPYGLGAWVRVRPRKRRHNFTRHKHLGGRPLIHSNPPSLVRLGPSHGRGAAPSAPIRWVCQGQPRSRRTRARPRQRAAARHTGARQPWMAGATRRCVATASIRWSTRSANSPTTSGSAARAHPAKRLDSARRWPRSRQVAMPYSQSSSRPRLGSYTEPRVTATGKICATR